jgi:serine/threonine protein kinase
MFKIIYIGADMSNFIGQDIGRYHVIEQLGQGGMAVVYKAYDSRLERNVAIKVIRFAQEPQDRFLKRFDREAKALAQLQHTNIVNVIDYGEHQGNPYLVMEYVPGGTLKQYQGKAISFTEAAHLLAPIARALEYAHQNNIIHRDVKPANILITASGQPMLSDFGVAKLLTSEETDQLTGTGVGVGTPDYMAPEQWLGTVGTFTDIYSLGVVFYELVTGRRPFTADTPAAVLLKAVNEALPRPRTFVPSLPEEVEQVIFKALAKKPEDRYEDMEEFAHALEKLEQLVIPPQQSKGQPVLSEGSSLETKDSLFSPSTSKKRNLAILAAVLIFALISFVVVGAIFKDKLFPVVSPVSSVSNEEAKSTLAISANPSPPDIETDTPVATLDATSMMPINTTSIIDSTSGQYPVLLSEEFNNQNTFGGYDLGIWNDGTYQSGQIQNKEGALKVTANGIGTAWLVSKQQWSWKLIKKLEGSLKISELQGDSASFNVIQLRSSIPDGTWKTHCALKATEMPKKPEIICFVQQMDKNENDWEPEFSSRPFSVEMNKWYQVGIEVNYEKFELSYYLDGNLIAQYIPKDAEMLKNLSAHIYLAEGSLGQNNTIQADVDSIVLYGNQAASLVPTIQIAEPTLVPTSEVIGGALVTYREDFSAEPKGWAIYNNIIKDGVLSGKDGNGEMYCGRELGIGKSVLVRFKYPKEGIFSFNLTNHEDWNGPGLRKIGFYNPDPKINGAPFFIVLYEGVEVYLDTSSWTLGSLSPKPDTWYYAFLKIGGPKDDTIIRVWEEMNPQNYFETRKKLGDKWNYDSWNFRSSGDITLDEYQELDY